MPSIDLAGKRTLVLGGSGVLGSAMAGELAERGALVILAGRDGTRLQARASEIGPDVPSVIFDLRVASHATHVVETATTLLGGLDGIVNAAGVVAFGPLADLSDAALDELVAADLVGPLRVVRAALGHLDNGFIVNLTGVVADTPVANMAAYSAVKAGLSAASSALGRELRRRGVHVLDARPPHTETGLATRPIAGVAPNMPPGLHPADVARTVVDGLVAGRRELPADEFRAA
jgi:NAD(P)-dependent dehydrogenase (short-subunit alcohol dehydrogenase family)